MNISISSNLSGSEDEALEPTVHDYDYTDTSMSTTLNSSADAADGECVKYSYRQRNLKYYPDGNLQELSETKIQKKITQPGKQESSSPFLWFLVVIIIIGLAAYTIFQSLNKNDRAASEPRIRCSFEVAQREFPNQNSILWKSLEHGVENVLNDIPTSPSIFLLAYQDVNSANRITRSIVKRTTECMQSTVNALELSPADLESNEMKLDYGVVIAKYRNQLAKSGVMLVNDLNKVPTEVAPAFHSFCDVQNPLVDRSIIFLTLQLTRQIHSSSNTNTLLLVESYLRSNWSGLQSFILDPLITRVTDQVFILNKE